MTLNLYKYENYIRYFEKSMTKFIFQARVGNTSTSGIVPSIFDINSSCDTSGAGPNDIALLCGEYGIRGRIVTVQRTQRVYDVTRPFLYVNEIDVHVGIENGQ